MPTDVPIKTTSLSTKGQVVIPEAIRKEMRLEAGAQFVVYRHGDTLMLKTIARPKRSHVLAILDRAIAKAKKAGARRSDIGKAIRQARARV